MTYRKAPIKNTKLFEQRLREKLREDFRTSSHNPPCRNCLNEMDDGDGGSDLGIKPIDDLLDFLNRRPFAPVPVPVPVPTPVPTPSPTPTPVPVEKEPIDEIIDELEELVGPISTLWTFWQWLQKFFH